MNQFKEWLSDNLRYFILLAALALGAAAIVLGVGMYKAYRERSEQVSGEANLQTEITVRADVHAKETEPETLSGETLLNEPEALAESEEEETQPAQKEALTKGTETVQSETVKEETETEQAETVKQETEAEQTETVKKEAEAEQTETVKKETETAHSETVKQETETAQSETARKETETQKETAKNETAVSEKETQESLPTTLPIKVETKNTETESESETQSETRKEFEIANLQIETNARRNQTESKSGKAGSSADDVLVGVSEQKLAASQTETQSQVIKVQDVETQPPTETQPPETQPQTEEIDTLSSYNSSTTLYASTSLNIRSGPGTEYGVLGDTDQGNGLTVTGETSNWYQVSYDGQTGYVSKNLLVTEYIPVYRTMTGTCYMRSEPDYGDNIIGEYGAGTTVEFLGDVGGWYKVRIDGQTGYMGTRFFE